jgi:hypothetical protein
MTVAPSADAPRKKFPARTRIALLLLLLILGLVVYGVYERFNLVAAQKNEAKASEAIRALHGMTVESNSQDWRILFVPDSPDLAKRVGGIYVPSEGTAPGYTDKVIEQLRVFEMCEQIQISQGAVSGAMRMGSVKKRVLKPGETPPELLDIARIRKEFPRLTVLGEEYLVPGWEPAPKEPEPNESAPPKEVEKPNEEKKADGSEKPAT